MTMLGKLVACAIAACVVFRSDPCHDRTVTQPADDLTDDELLRYSRHILLDELGVDGQARMTRLDTIGRSAGTMS